MKFKSDIEAQAGFKDKDGQLGSNGQILASTGSQVDWIDQDAIISAASKLVVIACKNTSGATITKGTPVYQTGTVGATDVIEVAEADASDEDKMAAIGLLQTDINHNDFGNVVITGELLNFITSPIDGVTPTTGDTIYVKSGGGLTLTKPTGLEFIQNVGLVGKVSGGNSGSITVSSIMRSNDVPTPLYIDHDNQRLGIGATSPSGKLQVDGGKLVVDHVISGIAIDTVQEWNSYSGVSGNTKLDLKIGRGASNKVSIFQATYEGGGYSDIILQDQGGKVGIGTTSPQADFVVSHQNTSGIEIEANFQMGVNNILSFDRTVGAFAYETMRLAAGDFWFTVLGTERMRIDSNGNVGIGTTNPGSLLHLSSSTGPRITLTDTDASIGVDSVIADISFVGTEIGGETSRIASVSETAGGEAGLRFYTGASVTQALKLDKDQNATFAGSVLVNGTNVTVANATNPYVYLNDTNAGAAIFQQEGNTTRIGSDSNTQVVLVQNNATAVTIDTSKNVGIGTTSPSEKLEVVGNANITSTSGTTLKIEAKNPTAFNDPIIEFVTWNEASGASSGKIQLTSGAWNNNDMAFFTETNNSVTEKMRITSAGGISFGSTGTAYGTAGQVLTSAGDASPTWTTPTTGTVTGSGVANQVAFWDGTTSLNGSNNLYWDSTNGHLGIGDATPGSRLKVTSGVNETSLYTVDINHVRNDANVATHAMRLNVDLSGADNTTADRTNSGLFLDIDSSANGDASNEHRIYGVNSDVKFSGFSDIVRGGSFIAESNYTGGKTAQLVGAYGQATHDSNDAAGGVSNMIGTYGYSSIQDTGDVDNAFGVYGLVNIGTNRVADVGVTKGVEGEISIDKDTAINYGTMIGISSIIDNNEGTVPNFGNQYLFKGDYQGTKGDNAWGIYTEGDKHYFEGKVGMGTTAPSHVLSVQDSVNNADVGISINNSFDDNLATSNPNAVVFINAASNNGYLRVHGAPANTASKHQVDLGSTAASSFLTFSPGDAERMRIATDGKVGMGTTSPSTELDVNGVVTATGGNSTEWNSAYDYTNGQNNSIQGKWYSGDPHDYVSGVSYYTYTKVANLAGNTTNASFEYYVKRDFNYPGVVKGSFTVSTYSGASMSVQHDLSTGKGTMSPQVYIDNSRNIWIRFDGAAWYTVMRWRCIFNEGVTIYDGTTSQNTQPTNSALVIPGDSLKFGWNDVSNRTVNSNTFEVYAAKVTDDLIVSGNVGIGTTSPGAKLSVAGDTIIGQGLSRPVRYRAADGNFRITPNSGGWSTGYFFNNQSETFLGGFGALGGSNDSFSYFWIGDNYNDTTMVIQPNAGNVGIGTTSPAAKLEVNGNVVINSTGLTEGFQWFNDTNEIFSLEDTSGAGELLLLSSNSVKVKLNANGNSYFNGGNVGIGTTSPVTNLQIASTGTPTLPNASGTALSTGSRLRLSSAGGPSATLDIGIGTGGKSWLQSRDVTDLSINYPFLINPNGGNVGIGTTSPNAPLHITGPAPVATQALLKLERVSPVVDYLDTSSSGYFLLTENFKNVSGTTIGSRQVWQNPGGSGLYYNFDNGASGGSQHRQKQNSFHWTINSTSEKLTLSTNGYLGINNTNPGYQLDVSGNARFTGGLVTSSSQTRDKISVWNSLGSYTIGMKSGFGYGGLGGDSTGTDYAMSFQMSNTTNRGWWWGDTSHTDLQGAMSLTTQGKLVVARSIKVGAGESTRSAGTSQLTVVAPLSSGGIGTDFQIDGGSGFGMKNVQVEIPAYGDGIRFNSVAASSVDNNAVTFYQDANKRGSIIVNATSTSYNTTSDYRLKENKEDISDAIERVKALNPVKFNWISEPNKPKVDGFYAHELAEVVPEAVSGEKDALDYENKPEYQSIDQSKIVPLLAAALQQAIDKIEILEQKIQLIENK